MRIANNTGRFERAWLPAPFTYYTEREGLRLHGRGTWRSARCCFHADDRPSLSINTETGGYFCHACRARGGDVLDFHRARHGLGFVAAARDLGAMR